MEFLRKHLLIVLIPSISGVYIIHILIFIAYLFLLIHTQLQIDFIGVFTALYHLLAQLL
jgi:hypothetical protein